MTCCEQLAALHRLAEIVGAMVLEVPKPKFPGQPSTYVLHHRIRELEDGLIAAGYDMPGIRERYKTMS